MENNAAKKEFLDDIAAATEKMAAKAKELLVKEKSKRKYVSSGNYTIEQIKKEIPQTLTVEPPPAHINADLCLPVFQLAGKLSKPPVEAAKDLAGLINRAAKNLISSAEAAGPYVNLTLNKEKVYASVIGQITGLKKKYGESDSNRGKTALIDYSGPNIAKPLGVGHLRSTIIGQALANIYEKTGFSVIKDNHLGDWGTQFGKLIYAYRQWGDEKKISENPIKELNMLYVKFHEEQEKNPELEDKAREIFKKLETGDERLLKLWNKFKKISVKEFEKIYKKLGVKFDAYFGESCFVGEAEKEIEKALNRKIAVVDGKTGAVAVESLAGLPSFLLRKQDGTTLYITRDLAALKFRVENFEPDETLFVVGEEQSLHFKQLFALAKELGYLDGRKAKHIGFGLVLSGGEKMSTRRGTLVELEELMKQSVEKSKEILSRKNRELSEKEIEEISEIVGVGAVIYNDLRQSRQTNISFDWDRMLDFEGGSAVYLQYTAARINSILKKAVAPNQRVASGKIVFEKNSEFALAKKMMLFPEVILNAQKHDAPHIVAVYLEELAQLFNHFYNEVSIIGTEDAKLRLSRIMLIKSVKTVIENGLALLNVKVPDKI